MAVVESWLTKNIRDNEILPVGYKIIRRDRRGGGGGVLLAVQECIQTESISFSSSTLELAATVILTWNTKVLLAVRYRAPDSCKEFVDELHRFLELTSDSSFKYVIPIGDFNFPKILWNNETGFSNLNVEHSFCDIMLENNLLQLVETPTRGDNTKDLFLLPMTI